MIMKILLISDTARSIFVYNFALWLRRQPEVNAVDVFEFNAGSPKGYDYEPFDTVGTAPATFWYSRVPLLKKIPDHASRSAALKDFLKGRHYDAIHCHWLVCPTVMTRCLKQHCQRLVATFWGGEETNMRMYGRHSIYMHFLRRFMQDVDCMAGPQVGVDRRARLFPSGHFNKVYAELGSDIVDALKELQTRESKADSKRALGIDPSATTILLGYSGKKLHNHLAIIEQMEALKTAGKLPDSLHLLAPMTRFSEPGYTEEVEAALQRLGMPFTMIKERFMETEAVARLRNATDVALQMSQFDGFSRSIIECLAAEAVVIYGQWLDDYPQRLASYGFRAEPVTTVAEGVELAVSFASAPEAAAPLTQGNRAAAMEGFSWSECIRPWLAAYVK